MQGEASGDPRLLSRGLVFGVVGLDERGGSLIVPILGCPRTAPVADSSRAALPCTSSGRTRSLVELGCRDLIGERRADAASAKRETS